MNNQKTNTGASICMFIMIVSFFTMLFGCNHLSDFHEDLLLVLISISTCLAAIFLAIEWFMTKKIDIVRADVLCVAIYNIVFAIVMWMVMSNPEVQKHWNWARTVMIYAYTLGGAIMIVGWFGDFTQSWRERRKAKTQ